MVYVCIGWYFWGLGKRERAHCFECIGTVCLCCKSVSRVLLQFYILKRIIELRIHDSGSCAHFPMHKHFLWHRICSYDVYKMLRFNWQLTSSSFFRSHRPNKCLAWDSNNKINLKNVSRTLVLCGLLWKEQSDSGNYHLKINNLISHLHVIVFFFFFLIWNLTISVNFSLLLLWLLFCWYIFVVFFPFWSLFRCMPRGRAHVCIWNCVRSTCIWPL